jgi:hyaluronoglucosaminidase
MGNEREGSGLPVFASDLTCEPGYEAAVRAAAMVLHLPAGVPAAQEGPSLHFGALPSDIGAVPQLGEQGYLVEVDRTTDRPVVRCLGPTPQGAFYALRGLTPVSEGDARCSLPQGSITSSPAFARRGIAEVIPFGWSWETRAHLLLFAGRHQLDHYLYAPQDDVYRAARWQEPYPSREAQKLADFIAQACELFVGVIFGLQAELDPADGSHLLALEAKCEWVLEAGAEGIALVCGGPAEDPRAWARLANSLLARLKEAHPQVKLWVGLPGVASEGSGHNSPLHDLALDLDPEIQLWWPGSEPAISRLDTEAVAAAARYVGRAPWLWENYPDNRFAPFKLFMGPYQGRDAELAQHVGGVTAVPMQQVLASQVPLATVADFLWDPTGYDPEVAWEQALEEVGGRTAGALRQFAGLNRSSMLNHREDEELETGLAAWELEGFHGYLARKLLTLKDALGSLGPLGDNQPLMRELAPWLEKAGYLVETASSALELSYSVRTTRKDAEELYRQTVLGLGRSRQVPQIVAPFRLDRFAVRVLRQAEVKMGKPVGRIQTTAPKGREHPWGLAADGDLMTSFRATENLQPGHSITLDMGTVLQGRWVHLSQGYFYYWTAGCVEEGRLLCSTDGERWEELTRIDGPGAWEVDLRLDPPRGMRYLRLVNDSPRPWPMVVRQLEVYE